MLLNQTFHHPFNGHGWPNLDWTLDPLWLEGDVLPRRLHDLVEYVGSDDSSDEGSGTHVDLFPVSDSDSYQYCCS